MPKNGHVEMQKLLQQKIKKELTEKEIEKMVTRIKRNDSTSTSGKNTCQKAKYKSTHHRERNVTSLVLPTSLELWKNPTNTWNIILMHCCKSG